MYAHYFVTVHSHCQNAKVATLIIQIETITEHLVRTEQ